MAVHSKLRRMCRSTLMQRTGHRCLLVAHMLRLGPASCLGLLTTCRLGTVTIMITICAIAASGCPSSEMYHCLSVSKMCLRSKATALWLCAGIPARWSLLRRQVQQDLGTSWISIDAAIRTDPPATTRTSSVHAPGLVPSPSEYSHLQTTVYKSNCPHRPLR